MADTEIASGAPEAQRSWGGYRPMKGKKRTKGFFGREGSAREEAHESKAEERKEQMAKKKKKSGGY